MTASSPFFFRGAFCFFENKFINRENTFFLSTGARWRKAQELRSTVAPPGDPEERQPAAPNPPARAPQLAMLTFGSVSGKHWNWLFFFAGDIHFCRNASLWSLSCGGFFFISPAVRHGPAPSHEGGLPRGGA